MQRCIFVGLVLGTLACNVFSAPLPIPLTSPNASPESMQTIQSTPAIAPDYVGGISRIRICNFSLEIPQGWQSQEIDPVSKSKTATACPGYDLTSPDHQLTLTLKPDERPQEAFQTCPAGTVIIQYTSMYIVRLPDTAHGGFVYSYSPLVAGPEGERLFLCQTPPALWVAGTFFTAELTKQDDRFDQMDLDTVDQMIQSIMVPAYQY